MAPCDVYGGDEEGARFGRGVAVVASFLAFLAFDWFFIQPRYTFTVAAAGGWLALMVFLVTASNLITLFLYAVYRRDPVFILGQGAGLFVYLRNLYFIYRQTRLAAAS